MDDSNQILGKFKEQFPEASVVLACEEDVTDDGCKDLIVIYTEKELTRTVAVIDSGDGVNYNFSTPIPGPIENQKIQFKNIDKEGEIEIIVTGEKKGAVGYAISVSYTHLEYVRNAKIGRAVMDADIFITLSHFKGHESTGFGGALKNIGMGCGSRAGKMEMHSAGKPYVEVENCIGCGNCIRAVSYTHLNMNQMIKNK